MSVSFVQSSSIRTPTPGRDPWQLAFASVWDQLGYHQLAVERPRHQMLSNIWDLLSPLLTGCCPERRALLGYLWNHLAHGFSPRFMLTYHYSSPAESGCSLQQPPLSSKIPHQPTPPTRTHRHQPSVFPRVAGYEAFERQRNDLDQISHHARLIRNLLNQEFWRQSQPNRRARINPSIFIFHELGRTKLQYHTHILIPLPPEPYTTSAAIEQAWHQKFQPKATFLSHTQHAFDIKPLPNLFDQIGQAIYLTKEVSSSHCVLDPSASLNLRPAGT
jgi:hypothetical protein